MYSDLNISGLLQALRFQLKNVERVAKKIGVDARTLRLWNKKTEAELHNLSQDRIESIIDAARDSNIEVERFFPPPSLWNFRVSFEENLSMDPGPAPRQARPFKNHKIPFLGHVISSRFGASASVMTSTSPRIKFLFDTGCSVIVYRTVRSDDCGSHPPPNILFCAEGTPHLKPGSPFPKIIVGDPSDGYRPNFGILNRFGMPSFPKEIWQTDFQAAQHTLKEGQLLILSVVPTAKRTDPETLLIKDSVRVVEAALAARAEVIELNCSCPNSHGLEGDLYRNFDLVEKVCKAVNKIAGNTKILLKIGYLPDRELNEFVDRTFPYVHGYSAINTVAVDAYRIGQDGPEPAFGKRIKAGLSGAPILRFGLSCVQSLAAIREREKLSEMAIVGIGGVTTTEDVQRYIESGADLVQCASAFFVDSYFAIKARQFLDSKLHRNELTADEEVDLARGNWSRAVGELKHEFGKNQVVWSHVELIALQGFQEWERDHRATIALGPRRSSPIPTIEDFKTRIKDRLRQAKN